MPDKTIPSYYSNINTELLNICPKAKNVLEFGCGAGRFLGAYKHNFPEANCVGFELFDNAAEQAREHCDKVIIGNAEDSNLLASNLQETSFDVIIYGDVLEHFLDPWAAMQEHLKYLKPGGTICACIPNVSNWSMIFSLINGDFTYKESGLMDRTHLRFFTFSTIQKMFDEAGMRLEVLQPRKFKLKGTEGAMEKIAKIFGKPLKDISPARRRDWATFQYLVRAQKPD